MDAIYDGAFLTIVPVEGKNPAAGLQRVSPRLSNSVSLESAACFLCRKGTR
jgi:hypothetical protein